jgi:hypothetical protein
MEHSSRALRLGWEDYLCKSDTLVSKTVLGRSPVKVQAQLSDAVDAFNKALVDSGYENPCDYIGSYLCRTVAGSTKASNHAYGIAIDLDYGGDPESSANHTGIDRNPHLHRKIVPGDAAFGTEIQLLEHQVRAIESIRNTEGTQLWEWLGWRNGDSMHFDINVSPDKCEVDWSTVGNEQEDDDMATLEEFVGAVRQYDIDKMVTDKIIRGSEGNYFKTPAFWVNANDIYDSKKTNPDAEDWGNLYRAWKVRSPIWAV